jgi:hypothetical protein
MLNFNNIRETVCEIFGKSPFMTLCKTGFIKDQGG